MGRNNWEISYEDFCAITKTIRLPEYYDDYFRLGKTHLRCYRYLIYIDKDLNVINPYTKKDAGKKIIYIKLAQLHLERTVCHKPFYL